MKKVICTIIILIILGGDGFLILNSDMFRKWRLGKQLSDKYGQNFEVDIYSKDDPVWAEEHKYTARSEEGVCSVIKCNWCGKLLADSYAHYYYAPDMNRLLESYIGECFGEYYIVSDYYFLGAGFKLGELVDVSDSESFDNYVNYDYEMKANFAVYLREDVTDEEIQNALYILAAENIDCFVDFLRVPDNIYDMVSSSGLSCFYPYSGFGDILLAHLDSADESEAEDFIRFNRASDYIIARYDSPEDIIWWPH